VPEVEDVPGTIVDAREDIVGVPQHARQRAEQQRRIEIALHRTVQADRTQGTYWVVTGGLAPGEKVITQGTANLRDGAAIKPVPATAPQRVKAPPPGASRPARQSG
jgi:multidrug efflux pump subunit AcrA (membrane-fusion protein)